LSNTRPIVFGSSLIGICRVSKRRFSPLVFADPEHVGLAPARGLEDVRGGREHLIADAELEGDRRLDR